MQPINVVLGVSVVLSSARWQSPFLSQERTISRDSLALTLADVSKQEKSTLS